MFPDSRSWLIIVHDRFWVFLSKQAQNGAAVNHISTAYNLSTTQCLLQL